MTKKKGNGKKAAAVLLTILVLSGGLVLYMIMPHTMNFTYVNENGVLADANDDHGYHYAATSFKTRVFIDSDEDLGDQIIGDQMQIKVRAIGLRYYRTDMMGMFVRVPTIIYEYAG